MRPLKLAYYAGSQNFTNQTAKSGLFSVFLVRNFSPAGRKITHVLVKSALLNKYFSLTHTSNQMYSLTEPVMEGLELVRPGSYLMPCEGLSGQTIWGNVKTLNLLYSVQNKLTLFLNSNFYNCSRLRVAYETGVVRAYSNLHGKDIEWSRTSFKSMDMGEYVKTLPKNWIERSALHLNTSTENHIEEIISYRDPTKRAVLVKEIANIVNKAFLTMKSLDHQKFTAVITNANDRGDNSDNFGIQ